MRLEQGQEIAFTVNQTPFYGESGGQVGDALGSSHLTVAALQVTDTKKRGEGLFVHFGKIVKGTFKKGVPK